MEGLRHSVHERVYGAELSANTWDMDEALRVAIQAEHQVKRLTRGTARGDARPDLRVADADPGQAPPGAGAASSSGKGGFCAFCKRKGHNFSTCPKVKKAAGTWEVRQQPPQ